jgi:hypothetical protein
MKSSLSESGLQAAGTTGVDAAVTLTTDVHVHVDDAIAPSTLELVLDDVDAEPSDWWWDQEFTAYSEEHLGRYGF